MTDSILTWREEMNSQLQHGKHVLLYGNVDDCYLLRDVTPRTVPLTQCLNHYFLEQKYQLIVHYDLADGMKTAIPEKMDALLLALLDGTNSRNEPTGSDVSTSPGQTGQTTEPVQSKLLSRADAAIEEFQLASQKRRDAMRSPLFMKRPFKSEAATVSAEILEKQAAPKAVSVEASENNTPESPSEILSVRSKSAEDVIPQLRRVLAQKRLSTVVVIHFSDKLFDDTRRQSRQEREYLLHLKKMFSEAAVLNQGPLAGRRNALILVASRLAHVPEWLYQEQPLLALVRIPSPLEEERRCFIHSFMNVFTRKTPLDEKQSSDYIQTFVDQTQGLALWDLMSLGAIANRSEENPIDTSEELRKLISLYRYGQKEDPWEKFNAGDRRNRIADARESIEKRVKGQPEAVDAIVEMLVSATVGISMAPTTRQTGKPKGIFFFVGPTGVGKTELAKALAELIFGDEARLHRFDMSEYTESHAAEKLTGSPPGYVGYEEGGQLTNFVRENPFSLLLFDEIEKAHGQVMDKFLQILEDGRLTDSKGQTVFFSQSVIIFTSNIGADSLFSERDSLVSDDVPEYESCIKRHFLEKVREHFVHVLKRPEILNRFGDNIIVFDVLRPRFVRAIGEKFLSLLQQSAEERRGLKLHFESSILEFVQKEMTRAENIKNGGRRIRTMLEDRLEKKLNRWIFEHQPEVGTVLSIGLRADGTLEVQ